MLATTSGETLKIISHKECEIVIEEFLNEIKNDISILKDCPLVDDEKIVSKSVSHSLFKSSKYKKEVESIKNIIFGAAQDCERFIGGSSDTFLLILEKLIGFHKDERIKYIQSCLSASGKNIRNKKRMSKNDINKIIKGYHPTSQSVIKKALSLCSPKTFLKIEKSNHLEDRVLEKNNLVFNVNPIPGFIGKEWIYDDVGILMIDGIVENVSQIHHFLTKAFETKEPFLLIARAYKPEVIKTIAENNARGLINVIPFDLGFSMENHYFLKDIAQIFDIQFASPELGDVISVFVRRGIPKIGKVRITKDSIEFFSSNDENLEVLRSNVIDIASKNLGEEVDDLVRKRLNSLSSDTVIISIGRETLATNPIVIEEIDTFVRRFISFMRDGIVFTKDENIDKIKKVYSSVELSFIYNKLLSVFKSIESIKCIITR